ncbi:MAG TPA: hypothetical protein ENF87_00300, partial [Thermoproteales archaeon]|nr:hypothetical protein [Thermoproteales archaeon]
MSQIIAKCIKVSPGSTKEVEFRFENKVEVNPLVVPEGLVIEDIVTEDRVAKLIVRVSDKPVLKPLWIIELEFTMKDWSRKGVLGILPVDENVKRVIVRQAEQDDKNYSVGALSIAKGLNGFYLSYRWRSGNSLRGYLLEISKSKNGLEFEKVKNFNKKDYGYDSFEQSALYIGDKTVFLYSADTKRRWRIYSVYAKTPEEIELPGEPIIDQAKDPAVYYSSEIGYIVAYSNTRNPGHDLTVSVGKELDKLEVKADSIFYKQLHSQGNVWAKTHIHAGAIVKSDDYYVLFYDALPKKPSCFGSGWLGVAVSKDLKNWLDLTPNKPLW